MSQIQCPQCGTDVDNQFGFGMIECQHCHHIFMAGEDSPSPAPDVRESLEIPEPPEGLVSEEEVSLNLEDGLPTEPEEPEAQTRSTSRLKPESFEDIVEFGNKQVEATGSHALYYNLEIAGIDTPEHRQQLEDILSDKKLALPPKETLLKVKRGVLTLAKVHPVRAAVLVGKLRETDFKVKWSTDQMIKTLVILMVVGLFGAKTFAGSWENHDQSLHSFAIRIHNLQDEIHETILKKNAASEQKKKDELLEDIKKKYADLRSMHKDFLKEMEHVRYEHPERGDKVERRYHHVKIKTMEELEADNSMEGQLTRLKRKAEQKYGIDKKSD